MNKTQLRRLVFANSLLGLGAMITLHFIEFGWSQLLFSGLLSTFSFGTGLVVGAVEHRKICGRD